MKIALKDFDTTELIIAACVRIELVQANLGTVTRLGISVYQGSYIPKVNEVKGRRKNQTILACSSVKTENFIRIIDNIPRNIYTTKKFRKDIKNRIKATSTRHIKTDFLYTLPRGGIAIHLHPEEDMENLENNIAKIYPGSSCIIPLKSRIE